MTYITKKGDFRAKIYQKSRWESVILFFFCFEAKTTPTATSHRWLNMISPKIEKNRKKCHLYTK